MLDFTAIDFETANKYANSACSLAAVTMNDDRCVKEGYTLIQPPFMRFVQGYISIERMIEELRFRKPAVQYFFGTEKAIGCLKKI